MFFARHVVVYLNTKKLSSFGLADSLTSDSKWGGITVSGSCCVFADMYEIEEP